MPVKHFEVVNADISFIIFVQDYAPPSMFRRQCFAANVSPDENAFTRRLYSKTRVRETVLINIK